MEIHLHKPQEQWFESLDGTLLTRLLKASKSDFVNLVRNFSQDDEIQVQEEIQRSRRGLAKPAFVKRMVALLDQPIQDTDLIGILKLLEKYTCAKSKEGEIGLRQLVGLAEVHHNLEVVVNALGIIMKVQPTTEMNEKVEAVLIELAELSPDTTKGRFNDLGQGQRLLKRLFGKLHLHERKHEQSPMEESLVQCYDLLRATSDDWVLRLLSMVKTAREDKRSDAMAMVIFDSPVILEPEFKVQPHIYIKGPVTSKMIEAAIKIDPQFFLRTAHFPTNVVLTESTVYFKYLPKFYTTFNILVGYSKISSEQFKIRLLDHDVEEIFQRLVGFAETVLHNYSKRFVAISGKQGEELTQGDKIGLLLSTLSSLFGILLKEDLGEHHELLMEKDILLLTLQVLSRVLRTNPTAVAWKALEKVMALTACVTQSMKDSKQPWTQTVYQKIYEIIETTYRRPTCSQFLWQAYHMITDESNIGINEQLKLSLSPRIVSEIFGELLDSLFAGELPKYFTPKELLEDSSPTEVQQTFKKFLADRLAQLDQTQTIAVMAQKRKGDEVINHWIKLVDLLRHSNIPISQETIDKLVRILMRLPLWIWKDLDEEPLQQLLKKKPAQVEDFYHEQLSKAENVFKQEPFKGLTVKQFTSPFLKDGKIISAWPVELYASLSSIISFNNYARHDYSEEGVVQLFTIFSEICSVFTNIEILEKAQQNKMENPKESIRLQERANETGSEIVDIEEKQAESTDFNESINIKELINQTYQMLETILKNMFRKLRRSSSEPVGLQEQVNLVKGLRVLTKAVLVTTEIRLITKQLQLLGWLIDQTTRSMNAHLNMYAALKEKLLEVFCYVKGIQIKALESMAVGPHSSDIGLLSRLNVRLLGVFLKKPSPDIRPVLHEGELYSGPRAKELVSGMQLDQLNQIAIYLDPLNIDIFERLLVPYIQKEFINDILQCVWAYGDHDKSTVEKLSNTLTQRGIRKEIAQTIAYCVRNPCIEAVDQWIEENKGLAEEMERILDNGQRQTDQSCIHPIKPEEFRSAALLVTQRFLREKLIVHMYTQPTFFVLTVRILKMIGSDALSLVTEVSGTIMSHFLADFQDNGISKLNEDRLLKQVTLLSAVVSQYRTRKDIRVKILSGHFFHQLLQALAELADRKQEPTKKRISILESGLSLVCWLLPNRNNHTQRTQQFLTVLAIIRRLIHWMNYLEKYQLTKWQELMIEALTKALRHNSEEISIECTKALLQLMDLQTSDAATAVSIIDAAILESQDYRLASMESEIKAFFFAHYNKQSPTEPIKVVRRSFVLAMKKYNESDEFYQVCEKLLHKSYDQTADGVRLAYIVYDPSKQSFSNSSYLNKPFSAYEPMAGVKRLLAGLLAKIFINEKQIYRRHLGILEQVLTQHPLLVSYIASYPLYGRPLCQKAVDVVPGLELVPLLFTLCLDCPVVVGPPGQETLVSNIIQRNILLEFYKQLSSAIIGKRECWLLLVLTSLLQLKEVNRLARRPLTKEESIFDLLKSTIEKQAKQKSLLFICEPFSLLLGQSTLDALDGLYNFYDNSQYGDLERQMIPLEVIFKESQALYVSNAENLSQFLPSPSGSKQQLREAQIDQSFFAHDYSLPLSVPSPQGNLTHATNFQVFIEDDTKFKRSKPEALLYKRNKNAVLWNRLTRLAEMLLKTPFEDEAVREQTPKGQSTQTTQIEIERIKEIKQRLSDESGEGQEDADSDEDRRFNQDDQKPKIDFLSITKILKEYKQQSGVEETRLEKTIKVEEDLELDMLPRSYSQQAQEQLLFIQTISDPSLRREVLMEIPSECLEKYPEDLRREAQNIKQGKTEKDNHESAEEEADQVCELKPSESLINQNLLLLNDLVDPELKMELLMECPSDQLALLPRQIQAEAQQLRWGQRDKLVMEHEQLEAKAETELCLPKKPPQPYVYSEITAGLFELISEETIKAALNTLCYVHQDSFRSTILVNLLHNKRVQDRLVTSLLILFRNPQAGLLSTSTVVYFPKDSDPMPFCFDYVVRVNIISVFQSLFEGLPYKDPMLLRQKIPYDGICGTKLQRFEKYNQPEDGYCPYVELLDYALSCNNLSLCAYLLNGTSELPEFMLRKLVNGLFQPNLPMEFLDSLQGLSSNETLERLFKEVATVDYLPEMPTQARLLKYKFAQLKFLRSVHINLLRRYYSDYNEFLNQIYRIYSEEEVKEMKELGEYKHAHRGVLQYLLNEKRRPSDEPIKIILKLPFCVDFATKKFIFRQQLYSSRNDLEGCFELKLNRGNIFQQSFIKIMAKSTEELKQKLRIQYEGQPGQDAGGLTRDWFQTISQEIFNRDYALFNLSTTGNTYQPSRLSYVNADHLRYFKFVGRVVGKALYDGELIGAYFTRSFYKLILGEQLQLQDLQEQDEAKYKGLLYYLQNPLFDEMYFTYTSDLFEQATEKELVPGGSTLLVTQQNKREWINRTAEFIMRDEIQPQIDSFLEGLHELIPKESLEVFDSRELELLISGLPSIDFDDLKNNVEYDEYEPTDKVIAWFWQSLEGYQQEQLAQVVQFITGTSRIPAEGFKGLRARDGLQQIQIAKSSGEGIPVAHTCFNRLDLPEYSTQEILQARLKAMLKWGNEGFGER